MYQPLRTKLVLLMAINETIKETLESISCVSIVCCIGGWLQALHRRMLMLFYNGPVQKDRKADGIVILTQILSFLSSCRLSRECSIHTSVPPVEALAFFRALSAMGALMVPHATHPFNSSIALLDSTATLKFNIFHLL